MDVEQCAPLPPDVLTLIFPVLNTTGRTSLASCARVSNLWNEVATPLLYRHIVLRPGHLGLLSLQFGSDVNHKRKDLMKYVECLTIGSRDERWLSNIEYLCGALGLNQLKGLWITVVPEPERNSTRQLEEPFDRIIPIVKLLQPSKIVLQEAFGGPSYGFHRLIERLRFLEHLPVNSVLILEVRLAHGWWALDTSGRWSDDISYRAPNLERLRNITCIFYSEEGKNSASPANVPREIFDYIARILLQLSKDGRMILVNSVDLHGIDGTQELQNRLAPSQSRGRFRIHLSEVVAADRFVLGVPRGTKVVDYVREQMGRVVFLDMEEYLKVHQIDLK